MASAADRQLPVGRQPHTNNGFVKGDRVMLAPELDNGRNLRGEVLATHQGRLGYRVRVQLDGMPWQSEYYYHALRLEA